MPSFLEAQQSFDTKHTAAVWNEAMNTAILRTRFHAFSTIIDPAVSDSLSHAIEAILTGMAPIRETLEEATRRANEILAEFREPL